MSAIRVHRRAVQVAGKLGCIVTYGQSVGSSLFREPPAWNLPLPWLGGISADRLFEDAEFIGESGGFRLFRSGDLLIGGCIERDRRDLTVQTYALYRRMLDFAGHRTLVRVWNYLPYAFTPEALTHSYRAFCRGRSLAFEAVRDEAFQPHYPASTTLGGPADQVAAFFVASARPTREIGGTRQTAPYLYPGFQHDEVPRYSRAVLLEPENGLPGWLWVSATGGVQGSTLVAPGQLAPQIDVTLDNLRHLSASAGIGDALGAAGGWMRSFKVYLADEDDYANAAAALNRRLFVAGDEITWLQAGLHRPGARIEIEATLQST